MQVLVSLDLHVPDVHPVIEVSNEATQLSKEFQECHLHGCKGAVFEETFMRLSYNKYHNLMIMQHVAVKIFERIVLENIAVKMSCKLALLLNVLVDI